MSTHLLFRNHESYSRKYMRDPKNNIVQVLTFEIRDDLNYIINFVNHMLKLKGSQLVCLSFGPVHPPLNLRQQFLSKTMDGDGLVWMFVRGVDWCPQLQPLLDRGYGGKVKNRLSCDTPLYKTLYLCVIY